MENRSKQSKFSFSRRELFVKRASRFEALKGLRDLLLYVRLALPCRGSRQHQSGLELPPIGWQLFALDSSQNDSTAFSSLLDIYATRLLAEPLSHRLRCLRRESEGYYWRGCGAPFLRNKAIFRALPRTLPKRLRLRRPVAESCPRHGGWPGGVGVRVKLCRGSALLQSRSGRVLRRRSPARHPW